MAHKTNLAKSKEMLDRINKRKADRAAKKTNTKLEEGTTEFRLMPAFNEAGEWSACGFFHYGFDEVILCPKTNGEDQACPICEFCSALWKGTDEDKEQAKQLGRKMRYFINIVPIALKNLEDEVINYEPAVKILSTSESIVKCLAEHMQNEDYGDITDPKTGRNIRIKREGKGRHSTRYSDPTPRPNASVFEHFADLEKNIVDLNEYVNKSKKTYEQIKAILENTSAPEGSDVTDDDPVDEAPAKTESKPVQTKPKDDWDEKPAKVVVTKSAVVVAEPVKETKDEAKKSSIKDRLAKLRATGK